MPDGPAGRDAFHLDHYRPKTKFRADQANYHNLFYSCAHCNRCKGAYWPSSVERANEKEVLNPDHFVMKEHLRYSGPTVVPRSRRGEWTCELLDLNDPVRVAHRETLSAVYERFSEQYDQHLDDLGMVMQLIALATSEEAVEKLRVLKEEKEKALQQGYRQMVDFFGVAPSLT